MAKERNHLIAFPTKTSCDEQITITKRQTDRKADIIVPFL